ncbi:hypothetical protein G7Y89_g7617 [Cudoniella acicularis]|uniref:Uncharacterized protein n=1 Tax=Cudoniella acicularis TaxID=354080 RepID=A0A8H4W1D6_9HELO|nr:hypothetical protein G7Y89_g7617 [Cudoniella acicularis]
MAIRYTPEELKFLKDSPLVVKPPGLPPAEQWMGIPADPTHQPNRRPAAERHVSRNSANPEDIILGPPKTSFMSATSIRSGSKPFDSSTDRVTSRDLDSRDRYNFRSSRTGDGDNDRIRDGRNNNLRVRRTEGEQDTDGWSTVKPRKSFGNEGAERFNGRMGLDKHKDERRFKDREDRDTKDRPSRGFDTFSRDKDADDQERDTRRNGTGRGRTEPSWFKDNNDGPPTPRDRNSNGDRFMDRSRGWREKEREDRGERGGERSDRGDRRWDRDRDQRNEREPEWLAEPEEDKSQTHTLDDFQKWKEQMQGKDKSAASKTPMEDVSKADTGGGFFGLEKPKVETPLAIDTGPDKFFGKWATPKDEVSPESGSGVESKKEGAAKAKATGKSSRFTSFFAPQEEPQRRQTEPPPAMPPPNGGLDGLLQSNTQSSAEKEAFQQLLQKLQRQTVSGTGSTPPANISLQPKPPAPERLQGNPIQSPETFQQYRTERPEERPSTRNSQQTIQDLLTQRQVAGSQPTLRPEQMLQELVGQRQNALSQSSVRPDQPPSRNNNNTEFLMNLMQSAKAAPEPQRSEQVLLRMPPQKASTMDRHLQQQMIEREQDMAREAAQRERSASQRQNRTQPPPGFFDDPAFQRGPPPPHERQTGNPTQPTQILQRPPPPGLEMGWERTTQLPPPQHRINQNIQPPPGLASGPNRAMPLPQNMFPPGFPMANFPPDVMPGPPRNMQMQPPPGFFNPPPPGFLPPGMSGGFQGPEMAFGGPFDGRGPPPQGAFRRQ